MYNWVHRNPNTKGDPHGKLYQIPRGAEASREEITSEVQAWIWLVVHLLLRFVKFGSKWELSFSRLAGIVRCAVWVRRELFAVLALMGRKRGTAGAGKATDQSPRPLISQGFLDFPPQNVGQQAA